MGGFDLYNPRYFFSFPQPYLGSQGEKEFVLICFKEYMQIQTNQMQKNKLNWKEGGDTTSATKKENLTIGLHFSSNWFPAVAIKLCVCSENQGSVGPWYLQGICSQPTPTPGYQNPQIMEFVGGCIRGLPYVTRNTFWMKMSFQHLQKILLVMSGRSGEVL